MYPCPMDDIVMYVSTEPQWSFNAISRFSLSGFLMLLLKCFLGPRYDQMLIQEQYARGEDSHIEWMGMLVVLAECHYF